jgi:hypothetical protein
MGARNCHKRENLTSFLCNATIAMRVLPFGFDAQLLYFIMENTAEGYLYAHFIPIDMKNRVSVVMQVRWGSKGPAMMLAP